MGSCISKCRPKKISNKEECIDPIQVQDKLVISQAASPPIPPPPSRPHLQTPPFSTQSSLSPLSPSSTSYSCSSSTSNSSSCSSLSSASSCASSSFLNSKDSRSFTNEHLRSSAKGDPHIIRNNESIKFPSSSLTKYHATTNKLSNSTVSPSPPVVLLAKHHQQQHYSRRQQRQAPKPVAPQKRPRAPSPSPSQLTRQKSFRRDTDRPNSAHSLSNRNLRSPSPSRRFSGGGLSANTSVLQETRHNASKRYSGKVVGNGKGSSNIYATATSGTVKPSYKSVNNYGKQERLIVRPSSLNNSKGFGGSSLTISGSTAGKEETSVTTTSVGSCTSTASRRTSSGTHEAEGGKVDINVNHPVPEEMDWTPSEDIDNPHISLDCFIFL